MSLPPKCHDHSGLGIIVLCYKGKFWYFVISHIKLLFWRDRVLPLVLEGGIDDMLLSSLMEMDPSGVCATLASSAGNCDKGAAARAWEKIEPECRKKLETNRPSTFFSQFDIQKLS